MLHFIGTMLAVAAGVVLGGLALKHPMATLKVVAWVSKSATFVAWLGVGWFVFDRTGWVGVLLYLVACAVWLGYLTVIDVIPIWPMKWSRVALAVAGLATGVVATCLFLLAAAVTAMTCRENPVVVFVSPLVVFGSVHLVMKWMWRVDTRRKEAYKKWMADHPCPMCGEFCDDSCEHFKATVAGSGPCRSRIPEQADHRFRSKAITDSGACRSLNA